MHSLDATHTRAGHMTDHSGKTAQLLQTIATASVLTPEKQLSNVATSPAAQGGDPTPPQARPQARWEHGGSDRVSEEREKETAAQFLINLRLCSASRAAEGPSRAGALLPPPPPRAPPRQRSPEPRGGEGFTSPQPAQPPPPLTRKPTA